jgi:hypothetical protein
LFCSETCIKGHRSSNCKHTDRPLFEIKKKGRPVTQCDHCRELRKTKQVHVKCLCEFREDPLKAASFLPKKKSPCKVPETAAFPNGLPEALETTAALQALQEGVSSDSDHGTLSLLSSFLLFMFITLQCLAAHVNLAGIAAAAFEGGALQKLTGRPSQIFHTTEVIYPTICL